MLVHFSIWSARFCWATDDLAELLLDLEAAIVVLADIWEHCEERRSGKGKCKTSQHQSKLSTYRYLPKVYFDVQMITICAKLEDLGLSTADHNFKMSVPTLNCMPHRVSANKDTMYLDSHAEMSRIHLDSA